MKSSLKFFSIAALAVNFLLLLACNGEAQQSDSSNQTTSATQQYTCPMHPEVVSDKPGECPKCGMDLVPKDSAPKKDYYMEYSATAKNIEANQPVTFSLTPKIKGDDKSTVNLDVVHTKKIHLIVVSNDLSFFNHIHPEQQPDGSYRVNETFPSGGKYILFADYTPTGGDHQVQRIEVTVNGKAAAQKSFTETSLDSKAAADRNNTETPADSKAGGYQISVSSQSGDFVSNQMTMLNATVKKDGKEIPASSLDDYLGAKAHMVIISSDGQTYLHVHPELENGKLLLHTEFPHEGMYRGWIQVQVNGKVLTGDFVFIVKQGEMKDNGEMKMDHEQH